MPHLRLRGVKPEVVQKLSETAHQELAALLKTSPDNFTFELVATQFFSQGKADAGYAFVEVLWFERGAESRQTVVDYLTARLKSLHVAGDIAADIAADIAVVFTPLDPANYFENGQHF